MSPRLQWHWFRVTKVISLWWHVASDREIDSFFLWEYRFSFLPFPFKSCSLPREPYHRQWWLLMPALRHKHPNENISVNCRELRTTVHIYFTDCISILSEAARGTVVTYTYSVIRQGQGLKRALPLNTYETVHNLIWLVWASVFSSWNWGLKRHLSYRVVLKIKWDWACKALSMEKLIIILSSCYYK